jgi:streptogramin lyase
MTPLGVVTLFRLPGDSAPGYITAGPDGNLWFTEPWGPGPYRIGRITPAGAVTEFQAGLSARRFPRGITAGPDGNLWFIQGPGHIGTSDWIGRITPAGVVTTFRPGAVTRGGVGAITAGPDGNLWFTVPRGDRIGRMTPAGVVAGFERGITPLSEPTDITAGSDGNLWFTQLSGNRIGRITPTGVVAEYPPSATIRNAHQLGSGAVSVQLRCPSTAASACRGTVQLTLTERWPPKRVGVRRFTVAPGGRAEVVVTLWAAGRRVLRSLGTLPLTVSAVPEPPDLGWADQREVVLRLPGLPAVAG